MNAKIAKEAARTIRLMDTMDLFALLREMNMVS